MNSVEMFHLQVSFGVGFSVHLVSSIDPASHIPLAQMAQLRCRSRHDCWTPGASLQPWLLKMARFHSFQRNLPGFIGIIRGSACCYIAYIALSEAQFKITDKSLQVESL